MKFSITSNFWLKVAAAIFGLLLWLHVATEKEYTYERKLPVKAISLAEGFLISGKPVDSITISVTGSGKQLLRQQWRQRGLRISASHLGAGKHELDLAPGNVSFNGDAQGLVIRSIVRPTHLELTIDERATLSVPVEIDLAASAATGFTVTGVLEPDPKQVRVTGPESVLKRLQAVKTATLNQSGLRDTAQFAVSFDRDEYAGLSIVPDSVSVTVCVEPVRRQTFKQLSIAVFNPPQDQSIKHRPVNVDIEISGAASLVEKLDAPRIVASADFQSRNRASHRAPIRIDCPSGITVISLSTDSVQFSN